MRGHWGRPWPGGIGWYTRAKLRRRLFAWFGASIVLSTLVVGGLFSLWNPWSARWHAQRDGAGRLLAGDLARVWESPSEREALARKVAGALEVAVVLEDASHRRLGTYGEPQAHALVTSAVTRGGAVLGYVSLSPDRRYDSGHWWFALSLCCAAFVLWGAAGHIARRLARPFDELARVAQELGEGKLSSRVRLACREHGEIRVLARALNEMAERIEKQVAGHRELLAGVSHELRTPLSRIRLLTELGREKLGEDRTLEEIDREIVEMDGLVDQLLASSRLDFQAMSPRPLPAEALARRALERAGLDGGLLHNGAGGAEIRGDATLLARALANLIDNAARHGGGLTRLSVDRRDEAISFEAEDAGPGFPEGEQARVFQAFYRAPSPDGGEHGTLGLGLSLVRRIAEAHGGRAWAKNRPGGGAAVGFEVPLREAPDDRVEAAPA